MFSAANMKNGRVRDRRNMNFIGFDNGSWIEARNGNDFIDWREWHRHSKYGVRRKVAFVSEENFRFPLNGKCP